MIIELDMNSSTPIYVQLRNQIVMGIDPSAFMIISKVNEVKGRGFSSQKIYQKKES